MHYIPYILCIMHYVIFIVVVFMAAVIVEILVVISFNSIFKSHSHNLRNETQGMILALIECEVVRNCVEGLSLEMATHKYREINKTRNGLERCPSKTELIAVAITPSRIRF